MISQESILREIYLATRQAWVDVLGADGNKYPFTSEVFLDTIREAVRSAIAEGGGSTVKEERDSNALESRS